MVLDNSPDNVGVEDPAVRIGSAIRLARKEARLTQQQLGELAGFSDRTVRDIELGTGSAGLRVVLEILDVLGLTLEVSK